MIGIRGLVTACGHCGRAVELIVYSKRAMREGFRGYHPFADRHQHEYGCYPDTTNLYQHSGPLPQIGE